MSKPDDIPQDIIDTAQALFDAERGEVGTIDVARAILAERQRCEQKCLERHDVYLESAGWVKDPEGGWFLPKRKDFDMENHNSFVSKANAAGSCAAAIRKGAA